MTWNYRIGTKLINGVKSKERVFSIVSCYYEKGRKNPSSYGESQILINCESAKDLKDDYLKIIHAINKPIIDLNNFPKKYKQRK